MYLKINSLLQHLLCCSQQAGIVKTMQEAIVRYF